MVANLPQVYLRGALRILPAAGWNRDDRFDRATTGRVEPVMHVPRVLSSRKDERCF